MKRIYLLVVHALLLGCSSAADPPADTTPQATPVRRQALTAKEVLRRMIAAYQQADAYSDKAEFRLTYRQGGKLLGDTAALSVQCRRPQHLRVQAYHLTMTSNDRVLSARVTDEGTQNLYGQFVRRATPTPFSLDAVYQDEVLFRAVSSGLGRHPVQLELLFSQQPLAEFLKPAILAAATVTESRLGEDVCYVVSLNSDQGLFTFWIGKQSWLLRKLVYPAESVAPDLVALASVTDVVTEAIFADARFDCSGDEARFDLPLPDDVTPVHHFVLPPQPLPSKLFGKTPEFFYFNDMQGRRIDGNALRGRTTALIWYHHHPVCEEYLRQIHAVSRQFEGSQDIAIYAICTEPSSTTDLEVQQYLRDWQVQTVALRDLRAFGRDVFEIQGAPTLVVLDRNGVVQIVETGFNPNIAAELPVVLRKLDAGEDLAESILAQASRDQEEFTRQFTESQKQAFK